MRMPSPRDLESPIEDLSLPRREYHSLKRHDLNTLADVLAQGERGLAQLYFIGPKQVEVVFASISDHLGLSRETLAEFAWSAASLSKAHTPLPGHVAQLPIEVLHLSSRARNGLNAMNVKTVGELYTLDRSRLEGVRWIGKRTVAEVEAALAAYIGTDQVQSELSVEKKLEGTRPEVPDEVRALPIAALNLTTRASNALSTARIATIGDLVNADHEKLMQVKGLGIKSVESIEQALTSFLASGRSLTPEELERLSDARPCLALDHSPNAVNVIEVLSELVRKIFQAIGGERDWEVLKRRYGLEGYNIYTFQELGDFYGVTRERMRQIERRALGKIRHVVIEDKSTVCRIPRTMIREIHEIDGFLRAKGPVLTESEIVTELENHYQRSFGDKYAGGIRLLLDLFGFSQLPQSFPGLSRGLVRSWILDLAIDKRELAEIAAASYAILVEEVTPLAFFDLKVRLNRRRRQKIESNLIRLALKICDGIESIENDSFQIRFQDLPSIADKACRILNEVNEPMPSRTICREINHRLAKAGVPADVSVDSLVTQLSADKKFAAVGRSGTWSLTHWKGLRRGTILELMEEFFHLRKSRATASACYTYVVSQRPDVSERSIATYLGTRPDLFVRVSRGEYELAEWGSKPWMPSKERDASDAVEGLPETLREIFEDVDALLFADLVRAVTERTSLSSSYVYRLLADSSLIELSPKSSRSRAKIARFTGVEQRPAKQSGSVKQTTRDRIQSEVKLYLSRQVNHRALMSELGRYVVKKTNCKRATFYRYLTEMPGVLKQTVDGQVYCSLVDDSQKPTLAFHPSLDKLRDPELRRNVERALTLLTVEDIDMGLFYLGKIFETEVKGFLNKARANKMYDVTNKDLGRLATMIDCLERNGIITQKHHLDLLREQRNERAHSEIPSLGERQTLMEHAPFYRDMYLRYILLLRAKRDAMGIEHGSSASTSTRT